MSKLHENIATDLQQHGGHLECSECGFTEPLGDIASKLALGWPKHCGYTMSWITARMESQV